MRPSSCTATDPEQTGILLAIVPTQPENGARLQRTTALSTGGAASTAWADVGAWESLPRLGTTFLDLLPLDGSLWYYRAQAQSAGAEDSLWLQTTGHAAVPVSSAALQSQKSLAGYPLRRDVLMTDALYAASADDSDGMVLNVGVGQNDGVATRVLARGHVQGSARHGDAVTFPDNFANVPLVLIRGGLVAQPSSAWGVTGSTSETGAFLSTSPVYDDTVALNLSVAGFDMRARLRQKGTMTARNEDFTRYNLLVAIGEEVDHTLANAPASADAYTVQYWVYLEGYNTRAGMTGTVFLTAAIDTSTGAGWTERDTKTATLSVDSTGVLTQTNNYSLGITVSGLTSTCEVRVRVKDLGGTGKWTVGTTASAHGYHHSDDPDYGVKYQTSADQYTSKTPSTDDLMTWEALETA